MTLYVDADACPVRSECLRVAERRGVRTVLVCNGGIRPVDHPLVEMVYVADGLDAADRWIAERAGAGDVVVTADIPLAAACVARGAAVLKPDGEALGAANVGLALATRNLMADLRAADPLRPGGGRPFAASDRARFLSALDRALTAASGAASGAT